LQQLTWAIVISAAVVIGGAPSPARAQGVDRQAAARALFEEGVAHADAGRWNEAADRFSRAHSLRPTPEIAYNLSTALARVGRLVSAAELLRQVVDDPQATARVRAAAEARLAEVDRRLCHVTVHADAPGPARVWLDGRPLDAAAIGVAVAVDPGPHVLELRNGARTVSSRTVSLADGKRETVVLEAPALNLQPTAPPPLLAAPAAGPSAADVSARPAATDRDAFWRKGWFWGTVASVAATVAVGALLASRSGQGDPVGGNVDTWLVSGR
jgi:hypothetical protein